MKHISKSFVITVLVFGMVSIGFGQEMGPGRGRLREMLFDNLDLTEQQKQELEELRDPDTARPLMIEAKEERDQLNSMLRDKSVSAEDILRQAEKVNSTQHTLIMFKLRQLLKVREVLNEDQLRNLIEMKGKFHEGGPFAGGTGKGRGFGDGQGPRCGMFNK